MRGKSWNNIEGRIYIECGFQNNKLIDLHTEKELPENLYCELVEIFGTFNKDEFSCEIEIPFLSSGYYDPGRTYGDPYYCYPPEGDDERILDVCCYIIDGKKHHQLSLKISKELFNMYEDDIMDEELDFSKYDDDSDYRYELMMERKYDYDKNY